MIIDIIARIGMRRVDLSVSDTQADGSRTTLANVLSNPATASQISAPEGAAARVNGGQVDPEVYALEAGDTVVFEKKAADKS